jgi:hypothetical protein
MKNGHEQESEALTYLRSSESHRFAIAASKWAMETTSGPEPGWEKAHTPLPRDMGDEWVWLPHDLHQIHGLLQSKDLGRTCFWIGHTYEFLTKGPFVKDWFMLFDIYLQFYKDAPRRGAQSLHREKLPDGRSKKAVEHCATVDLWEVTYPSGEVCFHSGLRQLCQDYDLKQGKLCLVAQGKRNHHKRFKVKKIGPSPLPPE